MNVASVVGARPQFVKAAPVSAALRAAGHSEILLHTGQHYDHGMSRVFFEELGIPEPTVNLGVGSGPHGWQTGRMLSAVEEVLLVERPDWVLVYGDTNSTLAGALAACKLGLAVAHVEAGLRSFNRAMPEEHNRVLTDHCADLLLCPTATAVENLRREGIVASATLVGDTMYDAVLAFGARAREETTVLQDLRLDPGGYLLLTLHRPYNTDDSSRLRAILAALEHVQEPIVFPAHPRIRDRLAALDGSRGLGAVPQQVRVLEPVSYLQMLALEQQARLILTDSGGVQKEAFFFRVPCVTLRPETEWVETVESGWNVVADTDHRAIADAIGRLDWPRGQPSNVFGFGDAGARVVKALEEWVR